MISEQEIRQFSQELEKLTGFIGEHGTFNEAHNKDFDFVCNVHDTLAWVLGEISIESFRSDAYTKLDQLKHIARAIEIKTGKKLADYE